MSKITSNDVYQILKDNFPSQNDFNKSGYDEELNELYYFGINTKEKLLEIITKHKSRVLEIDSEDLDDFHIKAYSEEFGKEYVNDKIQNKYWFAFQALLRIVLELEFDNKYNEFANKRDNLI